MLIVNGVIHTMAGEVIGSGFVQMEGPRIKQVGALSQLAAGIEADRVLDVQGGHVTPGLIDAHCHLGLYGSGVGAGEDDLNEMGDPCTPQLRGLDGVNPLDPYFEEARRAGVTCVLTGPGSANPVGGQSLLMKTVGQVADQMAVRAPAAMKFALGENPKGCHGKKGQSPMTRMATAAIIRESLARAREYGWKRAGDQAGRPDFDARLEALLPVVDGSLPAHFHAHRADDILTAIRISKEFGLKCVIVHGTEGHLVAEYLRKEGVPVIMGPILTDRSKPELANLTAANPALLAQAGVPVAICTDHPETPVPQLPLCAAMAVRAGMGEEEALASITIHAARIAGVDDRLGSLAPGKDGDIVVTDGHPLDWRSRVRHVFINGQEVARL